MNRSIRLFLPIIFLAFLSGCANNPPRQQKDWAKLFNEKDLSNWIVKIHHHEPGVNFGNTFRVEDGMIKVRYDNYQDFNDQFGHLYYKTPFTNFYLKKEHRDMAIDNIFEGGDFEFIKEYRNLILASAVTGKMNL